MEEEMTRKNESVGQLLTLLLFFVFREIREEAVKDCEDQAERESPPESVDLESWRKRIDKQNHQRIDDQQKESKGEESDGDCEKD